MGVETPIPPYGINSAAPKGAPRRINDNVSKIFLPHLVSEAPDVGNPRNVYGFSLLRYELLFLHLSTGSRWKKNFLIFFLNGYGSQRSFPAFPMFSSSCSLIRIVTAPGSTPRVLTNVLVNSFTTVRFCSVEKPFRILRMITGISSPSFRYCWFLEYLGGRENGTQVISFFRKFPVRTITGGKYNRSPPDHEAVFVANRNQFAKTRVRCTSDNRMCNRYSDVHPTKVPLLTSDRFRWGEGVPPPGHEEGVGVIFVRRHRPPRGFPFHGQRTCRFTRHSRWRPVRFFRSPGVYRQTTG